MLKIYKEDNALVVEGLDNGQFPDNGQLSFPLNSISVVIDESEMATFRSASNNDVVFSGLIENITINGESVTKDNIIEKFDAISNSSTSGGGGGGMTPEERQELKQLRSDVEDVMGEVATLEADKQNKLVSGTNIKTVNGQSLLGTGDITIEGGGGSEQKVWKVKMTYSANASDRVNFNTTAITSDEPPKVGDIVELDFGNDFNGKPFVVSYMIASGDGTWFNGTLIVDNSVSFYIKENQYFYFNNTFVKVYYYSGNKSARFEITGQTIDNSMFPYYNRPQVGNLISANKIQEISNGTTAANMLGIINQGVFYFGTNNKFSIYGYPVYGKTDLYVFRDLHFTKVSKTSNNYILQPGLYQLFQFEYEKGQTGVLFEIRDWENDQTYEIRLEDDGLIHFPRIEDNERTKWQNVLWFSPYNKYQNSFNFFKVFDGNFTLDSNQIGFLGYMDSLTEHEEEEIRIFESLEERGEVDVKFITLYNEPLPADIAISYTKNIFYNTVKNEMTVDTSLIPLEIYTKEEVDKLIENAGGGAVHEVYDDYLSGSSTGSFIGGFYKDGSGDFIADYSQCPVLYSFIKNTELKIGDTVIFKGENSNYTNYGVVAKYFNNKYWILTVWSNMLVYVTISDWENQCFVYLVNKIVTERTRDIFPFEIGLADSMNSGASLPAGNYLATFEQNGGSITFAQRGFDGKSSTEKTVDFKTINGQSIFGQEDIPLPTVQTEWNKVTDNNYIQSIVPNNNPGSAVTGSKTILNQFKFVENGNELTFNGYTWGQSNNGWVIKIPLAKNTCSGMMSAADKTKLDSLSNEWTGTLEEYKALGTYDDNTNYYIIEEE